MKTIANAHAPLLPEEAIFLSRLAYREGIAAAASGDVERALEAFYQALEYDPANRDAENAFAELVRQLT